MAIQIINRKNMILYPIYKMFSWDLLFYYAIIYLFLTVEKGLSPSLVLLMDALCQLSKLFFQLPCIGIIDLFGSRKSLILANILTACSILLLIISDNINMIAIFNILFAFAYNLKQLCESSILYDAIPEHKSKNKIFSKIDGIGQSYYYYLDSISAVFAGFLFIFNSYIPLVFCFICSCIAIFLAYRFTEETKEFKEYKKKQSVSSYCKELFSILKFIFQSKRLKCLLLYSGLFTGLLTLFINLRSIVLSEIKLPPEFFGIALGIIQIVSALSSKKTNTLQNFFKNKTLTVIAFSNVLPLIFIGLTIICKLPNYFVIAAVVIWLLLYAISKGPFYTLIKRYLQSFNEPEVTTKVYGIQTILNSLFATLYSLFTALLFNYISIAVSLIILSAIMAVIFIMLLDYMKRYVGLKPEEYKKSEITYVKLK